MNCPTCESPIADDCRFCTRCGVEIEKAQQREGEGENSPPAVSWLRVGTLLGAAIVVVVAVIGTVILTWLGGRAPSTLPVVAPPRVLEAPASPPGRSASVSSRTPWEEFLLQRVTAEMNAAPWVGGSLLSLEVDPRSRWARAILYVPTTEQGPPHEEVILRTACRAGVSLLRSADLRGATLRVISEVPGSARGAPRDVVFVADLPGPPPALEPTTAPLPEIVEAFKTTWWRPGLTPAPG